MTIKEKLCVIDYYGPIYELGNISGPILSAHKYPISKLITMINRGITIYEVNPNDRNERIRLTRMNLKTVNFPTVIPKQSIQKAVKDETNKMGLNTSFNKKEKGGSYKVPKSDAVTAVESSDFNNFVK